MYLLLGNTHMESSDYESAIDLLERARARTQHCQNRLPLVVSLVISPLSVQCDVSKSLTLLLTDVGMEI